jgi:hypothetical protein
MVDNSMADRNAEAVKTRAARVKSGPIRKGDCVMVAQRGGIRVAAIVTKIHAGGSSLVNVRFERDGQEATVLAMFVDHNAICSVCDAWWSEHAQIKSHAFVVNAVAIAARETEVA